MHKSPIASVSIIAALVFLMQMPVIGQGLSADLLDRELIIRSFVENQGQMDKQLSTDPIQYGFEGEGEQIYLTANKVYFNLYRAEKHVKTEEEQKQRTLRKKKGFPSREAFVAFEKAGKRLKYSTDLLVTEWLGANPKAEVIATEKDAFTHSYEFRQNRKMTTTSGIHSFQKIIYKNLYPNIDVEYTVHPKSGLKYSLILHPGADLSQVKLYYSKTPELQLDGALTTATKFGDVMDHKPFTFYQDSKTEIASAYVLNGNEISFELAAYDASQTVVIDPWTDLPNDPGSNWNCAWECETDALGNTYAIFGAMPLQLRKYNAAGTIQWTYNTTFDTTAWLGTFVTDDAGNSYVTNGSNAAIRKVSPAGGLIWSVGNNTGQLLGEFWNIAFNCDQTKLIVGGTGGFLIPEPYIYDVDMTNGALLASLLVHQGTGLLSISEIRAITATENAKYYWLSHDSIGYVSQNFAGCPNPSADLIALSNYDLSYKCENWRYNNTGIEAIAYYGGFVYVNRGNRIDKRDFNTANIVASSAIPGGGFSSQFGGSYVENSGIIISNAGRIFVGSKGSVSEYDANLVLIATYPVTGGYNVYDVDLTSSGQVIACGATGTSGSGSRTGTVESLGVLAAGPYVMSCCDASICRIGPLCDADSPVTLTTGTGGGTWTSTAPGFNTLTGVFDPTIAGIGTYTFYYTLGCGADSLVLTVVFCPTLSICEEPNGDLSVSGGTAPYTWETGTMVTSCVFLPGGGCGFLDHAVSSMTWTQFAIGTTVTPPAGADTVRVSDATYSLTSWDISTVPLCVTLPSELTVFEGRVMSTKMNSLEWVTAAGLEYSHFTLQNSGNGKDWKVIATLKSENKPSGESNYKFIDHQTHFPATYYRLGVTNMDGNYQHLAALALLSERKADLIANMHPNPADDMVRFDYFGSVSDKMPLNVTIVNGLGAIVKEVDYAGLIRNTGLEMDVSGLASGVYLIRFRQGLYSEYRKIVIMHRH